MKKDISKSKTVGLGAGNFKTAQTYAENQILDCTTGASVLSGGLGFWAGVAVGGPLGILGFWGLGAIGSMVAASVGGEAAKALLDLLGEDDFERMKDIIEEQYTQCLDDYLITQDELTEISRKVTKIDWSQKVRSIHASPNWEKGAYKIFEAITLEVLNNRKIIWV